MRDITPKNYDIFFEPNLKSFKFTGKERITFRLGKPTNKIILNAADLKISKCEIILQEGRVKAKKVKMDNKNEELEIVLPRKIRGDCEINIEFRGELSNKLVGFYRSKYEGKNRKPKYLATTQFEAADARRAFPCWDDPSKKATFTVSMLIDKNLEAISNMPAISTKTKGGKKLVKFAKTPVMSTYLLYLGVGDFEFIEGKLGATKIRVATTPGKKSQGKMALEMGKKFLDYYQKYFKIKYPLPKLDLIAIPDFASGAMENWGAITFRETTLLFDEKTSSASTKQRIAEVIAHELAHQWFGNLVTMKWWNDLWLNESFATFIGTKAVNDCYPEWDVWSQFLNADVAAAFRLDALKNSHKIEVEVRKPSEINEIFDEISYEKGGSVLKMLYNYLGEEKFRRGLITYLKKHQYSNATTEDLWKALSSASGSPVKKIMNTWVRQTGYPIIEVERKGPKLKLSQKRFLLEGNITDKSTWMIPLSISLGKKNSFKLMKTRSFEMHVGNEKFVKINAGQHGFYRVKYPTELLDEIKSSISSKSLSNADRWGLQNDLFTLCTAGAASFEDYLDLVEAYSDEDDYLVVHDILDNLYSVFNLAANESFSKSITDFNRRFFRRHFDRLGWMPKEGEKHTDSILRPYVILSLGEFGDEEILKGAKERFELFLENPDSLHPDIRGAVYSLAAWQGGESVYTKLKELYVKAKTQEESRRFLMSLTNFRDEELLKKTLDYSLSKDVRSQDIFMPIVGVTGNPHGRKIAWPWIRKNWKGIIKRHGGLGHRLVSRIIDGLAVLANPAAEKEVREFFRKNPTPGTERAVEQTLEDMRINYKFLESLRNIFAKYY